MAALNSDQGRWGHTRQDKAQALAARQYKPVVAGGTHQKNCDTRTREQRDVDLTTEAEEKGVSRRFLI